MSTYRTIVRSLIWGLVIYLFEYVYETEAATRSYRSRRYTSSGAAMEPWMIALIVVSALAILSVPVVFILCIKFGCCKVVQRTNNIPEQGNQAPGQQLYPPPYGYGNASTLNNSSAGNQFYMNGTQGFPPPQQNNYTSPMGTYNMTEKY